MTAKEKQNLQELIKLLLRYNELLSNELDRVSGLIISHGMPPQEKEIREGKLLRIQISELRIKLDI